VKLLEIDDFQLALRMTQSHHPCVSDLGVTINDQSLQIGTSFCDRFEIFGPKTTAIGPEIVEVWEGVVVEWTEDSRREVEVVFDIQFCEIGALKKLGHRPVYWGIVSLVSLFGKS